MSNVNVQVSLTNLTQMDRFQSDSHRTPMVNQEQNSDHARTVAGQRLHAPVQPDQVEGKKIDPQAKREEDERRKKKRKQQMQPETEAQRAMKRVISASGHIVDYEA